MVRAVFQKWRSEINWVSFGKLCLVVGLVGSECVVPWWARHGCYGSIGTVCMSCMGPSYTCMHCFVGSAKHEYFLQS